MSAATLKAFQHVKARRNETVEDLVQNASRELSTHLRDLQGSDEIRFTVSVSDSKKLPSPTNLQLQEAAKRIQEYAPKDRNFFVFAQPQPPDLEVVVCWRPEVFPGVHLGSHHDISEFDTFQMAKRGKHCVLI